MPKVKIWGYRCERCGHEWVPRDKNKEPQVCPKCKSPYWDTPRRKVSGKRKTQDVPRLPESG
jgi:predicted Zn-ribbon and HTH transcriptional regulator